MAVNKDFAGKFVRFVKWALLIILIIPFVFVTIVSAFIETVLTGKVEILWLEINPKTWVDSFNYFKSFI